MATKYGSKYRNDMMIDAIEINSKNISFLSLVIIWLACCINPITLNAQATTDSTKYDQLLSPITFRPNYATLSYASSTTSKKFDPNALPIFCKIEHLIESKSKIGFRFRLGDLNYVNMLENKR